MKVYEGNILTVNQDDVTARYLVEDEGRIVYVGNSLPEKYSASTKIEVGERSLIPAFCDTHQHFASFSTFHSGLNVMECSSNEEILQGMTYKRNMILLRK